MTRRALALVPVVLFAFALPGQAAPAGPQIVDAKGDSVGAQASMDIVSGQFSTTGVGKGKAYRPTKFIVTMTLAAPPSGGPGVTYEMGATTSDCGEVDFTYEPGTPYSAVAGVNGWANWGDCPISADGSVELLAPKVKGNTITWSFGIKQLGKGMKVGTVFSELEARVDPSNPVIPFPSSLTGTELGLIDKGTGTGTWKLG